MTFDRWDILIVIVVAVAVYMTMAYRRVLPSVSSIQELATVVNTKGGIVIVLGSMSSFFFVITIWLIYVIIQDLKSHSLREDNAIVLLALQFCMNNAFSLCLGAMLKTMTGENPVLPGTTTTTIATSPVEPKTATTSTTTVSTVPVEEAGKTATTVNGVPVGTELKAIPKS